MHKCNALRQGQLPSARRRLQAALSLVVDWVAAAKASPVKDMGGTVSSPKG